MRRFLQSLIRMRLYLIANKKNGKNPMRCYAIIHRVSTWLDAYPRATEEQVRAYVRRNMDELRYILPDGKNPAHLAMHELLNELSHDTITH